MSDPHTKTLNTSGGKNRIKFASSKKRGRSATANVYRAKKSGRESSVHHTVTTSTNDDDTSLALELDLAMDRNASEIFRFFYRKAWPLVRSLPEVLHHVETVLDLLLEYVVSPANGSDNKPPTTTTTTTDHTETDVDSSKQQQHQPRQRYIVNAATLDILHLLSVLARDVRHELHPYLHTKIMPRILHDLLQCCPTTTNTTQELPLDVTFVEAAFRTLSYVFRYDGECLIQNLEPMRQWYYGPILGHARELYRRLGAECLAPLIRKQFSSSSELGKTNRKRQPQKHLKKVLKALVSVLPRDNINNNNKLYLDAVDGVSRLFFEVARGAVGKLHSKGGRVAIQVLMHAETMQHTVVFHVAEAVLDRLGQYLTDTQLILMPIVERILYCSDDDDDLALVHYLKLLQLVLQQRNGKILRDRQASQQVEELLRRKLLAPPTFSNRSTACRTEILNLCCSIWIFQADNEAVASVLTDMLQGILLQTMDGTEMVASFVVGHVLPHLSTTIGMGTLGSAVLSQAATLNDNARVVALIHCLAVTRTKEVSCDDDNEGKDNVYFLGHSAACNVSNEVCQSLMKSCPVDDWSGGDFSTEEACANYVAKCSAAAFVSLLGGDGDEMKRSISNTATVLKGFMRQLERMDKVLEKDSSTSVCLTMAITIELLAQLQLASMDFMSDSSVPSLVLNKVRPVVLNRLMNGHESVWTLKAVARFVKGLSAQGCFLTDDVDSVFEILCPHLSNPNHFIRLHCLTIMSAFPKRPFVVDHADLDLTDDLDEEASPAIPQPVQTTIGPSGLCDIIDTLRSIESSPISLKSQRIITSLVSKIGVLGRTGKLPVIYAEAAGHHLLGLLYTKYSLVWPHAIQSLVSLAKGHENCVWPALHRQIDTLMSEYVYARSNGETVKVSSNTQDALSRSTSDPGALFKLCEQWDSTRGLDARLFAVDLVLADELGKVSGHLSTDEITVLESLWAVAAGAPQLIAAHSRTIVPIFVNFMHYQFYGIHEKDPDIRELRLRQHTSENCRAPELGRRLDHGVVQRRLLAMLRAFAKVKGPKQLVEHKLLYSIFQCLSGNQDTETAQLAFSCLQNYKVQHITPYVDLLKSLYEKGKFRDALMNIKTAAESGTLLEGHREGFLLVMSRILSGRLSARAIGSRSSKDSPVARRNAALSFMASLTTGEEELYPFLYLMVRVYIPRSFSLKPLDLQNDADKHEMLDSIASLSMEECLDLPIQVHQGFLNVLGAVISQLGQKFTPFVPTFASVVVRLCSFFAVNERSVTEKGGNIDENASVHNADTERHGTIRSLCYKRLSDFFSQYCCIYDFTPHLQELWASLQPSLEMLPAMVQHSDHAPALLLLMETISGEETLVPMLSASKFIVPAVLKCLSSTTKSAIVDAVLSFIDNLVPKDLNGLHEGTEIVLSNLELLLEQFRLRLSGGLNPSTFRGTTWRRELLILCRTSVLIGDKDCKRVDVSTLCELLFPYLGAAKGVSDSDKQMVLDILCRMLPMVSKEAAPSHFKKLSSFLGISRGKPCLESRDLRRSVGDALTKLSASVFVSALPVTDAVAGLCAVNTKRLNEMDYDRVLPVLGELGSSDGVSKEGDWSGLSKSDEATVPSLLLPIVNCCFNFLFDDDGVVSRSAFKALKSLVVFSRKMMDPSIASPDEVTNWTRLLEGTVISMTRTGLATRNSGARRFFILLLRDIAWTCRNDHSPNRYSDLSSLVREDEPDLDFFLNITHVQVHRKSRALQRLRKHLAGSFGDLGSAAFSQHSLSNVLLPLATHFIYESTTNIEQPSALEAIATAGAISRYLSWSKYNSCLWTHLSQFERHPQQEHYLVGLMCAIIDGFHFDVENERSESDIPDDCSLNKNSVWRALETRIIPKIESMVSRPTADNSGKILRPSVVLALFKLFKKLPAVHFRSKLSRLLTVVCDALGDRESNSRDVARKVLANMVVEMDMAYLGSVLHEVATSLTEGYRLHVRTATLHTLLMEMSSVYHPEKQSKKEKVPTFDTNLPRFLDLIQQDLFGHAQERRDVQGSKVRYVKEATGSKGEHSLELLARMVQFSPTTDAEGKSFSSVHLLTSPFLERLRSAETTIAEVKRSKECLARIVAGLLKNPSRQSHSVLYFVEATLNQFVAQQEVETVMLTIRDDDSGDDELKPIVVSGSKVSKRKEENKSDPGEVSEWRPSHLRSALSTKEALDNKKRDETEVRKVLDGSNAPKLTGSYRGGSTASTASSVNDPTSICAVTFCLKLLSPTLRYESKNVATDALNALVPNLATCVCKCRDTEVILLSLKCIGWLSRNDLPSLSQCSKSLSTKVLELLISAGGNQDLLQASFKTLTFLLKYGLGDVSDDLPDLVAHKVQDGRRSMPLDDEQADVLVSFLRESVMKSENFGGAIALIRAIMSTGYISPEFYDLMDTLLEQSVRSRKASLRDQCGAVFLNYIVNYPLSPEKLEKNLKQIVLNVNYDLMDGRLSAIKLIKSLFEKLPVPIIEQHRQLFFLPLTLQLANDESSECREAITNCLGSFLKRLSSKNLQSLYEYTMRWSQGEPTLQRTSLQLFGIFVDLRPDFIQGGTVATNMLATARNMIAHEEWETAYFALVLLEKMQKSFADLVVADSETWRCVVAKLLHGHPWVRLASCRLLNVHFQGINPLLVPSARSFLVDTPAGLHIVARNLCTILEVDEQELNDDLLGFVVKNLTWCLQAMKECPGLCYTEKTKVDGDPIKWVLARLSQIAKKKGRRAAVFKCFAKFVDSDCDIFNHLELLLEPLHRSELEARNETTELNNELAQNVLYLIEERAEETAFLQAYSNVKKAAQVKKDQRHTVEKQTALSDPLEYAKKRMEKQAREKNRRRKRMHEKKTNTQKKKRRHL